LAIGRLKANAHIQVINYERDVVSVSSYKTNMKEGDGYVIEIKKFISIADTYVDIYIVCRLIKMEAG